MLSTTVVGAVSTTVWSVPLKVSDHDRLDGGLAVNDAPLISAVAVVVADAAPATAPVAVAATETQGEVKVGESLAEQG